MRATSALTPTDEVWVARLFAEDGSVVVALTLATFVRLPVTPAPTLTVSV